MEHLLRQYIQSDSGGTAIEYGLITAIISVGIITSASLVGCQTNIKLWQVNFKVANA
ncbi:MAG: Flp family type IVb pilin [Robiginitomaculum sp.]|nr:Flp family type IVb pilin [Robiginitomaculum sp.]